MSSQLSSASTSASTAENTTQLVTEDGKQFSLYTKLTALSPGPSPNPPPPNPPPQPPNPVGNIGIDGVLQILPTLGAELYLTDNQDKNKVNVSYGTGSHLPLIKKQEGNLVFFNTTGNPISYHSGNKPGRSVRLDFYTDNSIWSNKTKFAWDNNPGWLLEAPPKCIESGEYTIYLRPHSPLGSQQSCAWKLGGRDEDSMRSLFEICAADSLTHKNPYCHWDYLHFPYIACPTKLMGNHAALTAEKWYALKALRIVDPSKRFCDFYLFEDPDPIDTSGKPRNNWRLIASAHDAGTSGYKNIPCSWASAKDLIRIDGFQSVDVALGSVRRVDIHATPTIPFTQHAQLMSVLEPVDPNDQSKWTENPHASVEEVEALKTSGGYRNTVAS